MKKLLIATLIIFFVQNVTAQVQDKNVQTKWIVLKSALKTSAGYVVDLSNDFLKLGLEKDGKIKYTNTIAKSILLDSNKKFNVSIVKDFNKNNDSMAITFMEFFTIPNILTNAAAVKKIDVFVKKMDANDKIINVARKNYNAACKVAKRDDLVYVKFKD